MCHFCRGSFQNNQKFTLKSILENIMVRCDFFYRFVTYFGYEINFLISSVTALHILVGRIHLKLFLILFFVILFYGFYI